MRPDCAITLEDFVTAFLIDRGKRHLASTALDRLCAASLAGRADVVAQQAAIIDDTQTKEQHYEDRNAQPARDQLRE